MLLTAERKKVVKILYTENIFKSKYKQLSFLTTKEGTG